MTCNPVIIGDVLGSTSLTDNISEIIATPPNEYINLSNELSFIFTIHSILFPTNKLTYLYSMRLIPTF